jgi:hypothetical protein
MQRLLSSLAVAFILLAPAGPAFAQSETQSVKIEPAIIEERIDPGQSVTKSIRITNPTASVQTYYLLVRDILDVNESGQPTFAEEGKVQESGVSAWIRLSQKSLSIRPGETKEAIFTVTAPKDAFPGGHFGGVFASVVPPKQAQNSSAIAFQVGTILSFRISGQANEAARIREFRSDKGLYSKGPVNFTVRVENLGNVLVRPQGFVDIENMFGRKIATLDLNAEGAGVYPQKDRPFLVGWDSPKFAFGRYQAIVSLSYGEDGKKTISSFMSFWVLPLNLIVPVLGTLLAVIVGAYLLLRWYVAAKVRELSGGRATADASRTGLGISRLLFMTLATLAFTIVFLGLIFFLFS